MKINEGCKDCIVRKFFDKWFKCEHKSNGYDYYLTYYGCGCVEHHWYDDTPGFRENDKCYDAENCCFDREIEIPRYKGTYEDLFKY